MNHYIHNSRAGRVFELYMFNVHCNVFLKFPPTTTTRSKLFRFFFDIQITVHRDIIL